MAGREQRGREDGFTVLELMVVVLIIAILIAIAYPTYRGAQNRAGEKRAMVHLRNAAMMAKTITDDLGFYVEASGDPLTPDDLREAEGSLAFSSDSDEASTRTAIMHLDSDPFYAKPNTRLLLYLVSEPGRWFGIVSTTRGGFRYCSGTEVEDVSDPDECWSEQW